MTARHVPSGRLVAIAAGAEPDDLEASHLLDCGACTRALEGDDAVGRALAAARRVEPAPWDDRRVLSGQARLVGAARRRKAMRLATPALAGALAAAAAWTLWQRPPGPRPSDDADAPTLAEVERQPDATVELAQAGPDEVVHVPRGQAAFKVKHLRKAERFRVRCGRDEVEVRGTRFVVRGGGEGFQSVNVTEGAVELRTECCGTRLLRAGDSWARPSAAAPPPSPSPSAGPALSPPAPAAPPVAIEPPRHAPKGASGQARTPTAQEPAPSADVLRQRGLEAYDGGDYGLAARSFESAAKQAPDAPWAADARTLAGAALVLQTPPSAIASLSVGVASLDAAAQRAQRSGDAARASAARVAAARRSSGDGARKRWCALRHDAVASAEVRSEATRQCPDGP